MKYFLVTLFFTYSIVNYSDAQICNNSLSYAHLNINNVDATIDNADVLWSTLTGSGEDDTAGFVAPKGGSANALFAGALWIGGIDQGGQLHLAAATYRQSGNDFFPGPLDSNGVAVNTLFNFDTVWVIYKSTIDSFRAGLFASIPNSIKYWPAQGNPSLPNLPNQALAPYVDVNNNGIYDPANGDYPAVNGDEATWEVFNDNFCQVHGETHGLPLGIEVHLMTYAFKVDSGNSCLNYTNFYHYNIYNKSKSEYDSTYVAIFADPDIGCFLDDYAGCIEGLNMGVGYNGEAIDGGNGAVCPFGIPDYGAYPPLLGIQMINLPLNENGDTMHMESFMSYINDYTINGNPTAVASCYYNLMRSRWCDNTHLTYYGDGHGGTTNCNYSYPSDPTDTDSIAWSDCHDSVNGGSQYFSDVRFVMGFGPTTFNPGSTISYTFDVLFDNDTSQIQYPCPSFASLINMANCVKAANVTGINTPALEKLIINFYPNPMGDAGTFSFKPNTVKEIKLFNILGEQLRDYTGINGTALQLQRGDLSPGIYFYSVITKTGITGNGKIVIQ